MCIKCDTQGTLFELWMTAGTFPMLMTGKIGAEDEGIDLSMSCVCVYLVLGLVGLVDIHGCLVPYGLLLLLAPLHVVCCRI